MKQFTEQDDQVVLADCEGPDGVGYCWVINERTDEVSFTTKDKKAIKGFKDFMRQHNYMDNVAVSVGIDSLEAYRHQQRQTARFFGKTPVERRIYGHVVRDLMKSGQYTLLKDKKRVDGGWLWELKRKKIT